jgi:CheY-like chemotaxis protein
VIFLSSSLSLSSALSSATAKKSLSVLLVDDEADIIKILQLILKKHDVIVSAFTDPTKALSHFESNMEQYRVVVSDIKMREMNGFEFTSQVKRLSPGIKVLLMTAFDVNKEDLEDGMKEVEIDGFIRKPFAREFCPYDKTAYGRQRHARPRTLPCLLIVHITCDNLV